MAATVNKKTDT